MMKKTIFYFLSAAAISLSACNNQANDNTDEQSAGDTTQNNTAQMPEDSAADVLFEKGGIKVSYFQNSQEFPNAALTMLEPATDKPLKEGKVMFRYKVENYELASQTGDAQMCNCANSAKGQHIHQILNNEPYTAHYTDTFSKTLKPGHYVNLSFLSRSYHESIKNNTAYVLNQFTVGKTNEKDVDLKAPLMFYSRPKGEYKGKETENVLLDFYLVNTTLSPDGNKVRATINGNEFVLDKWAPYAMRGLPKGENTVKLELIDKDGKVVPGPFNTVERKFTLSE